MPRTSRWPSGRHQITDMVATTFDNKMRPVWLLFEGGATCSRLCPSTSTWPTTFSPSLWANERMTLEFADMLVAYKQRVIGKSRLLATPPAPLIWDVFCTQRAPSVVKPLKETNICVAFVPVNSTGVLQLCDASPSTRRGRHR